MVDQVAAAIDESVDIDGIVDDLMDGLLQGEEGGALELSDDGVLSLELDVVVRQVRSVLIAQGLRFAELIPEVERSIPIIASDSLALTQAVYQLATAAGYWLPWLVGAVLVGGVLLARDRMRAVMWAAIGLSGAIVLLASGLGIGRRETGAALFDQITALISSSVAAMAVLGAPVRRTPLVERVVVCVGGCT